MSTKSTGESMNRDFINEDGEVIASSSVNVILNGMGSVTITFQDTKKLKNSQTISEDLKLLIDDILSLANKYSE